MFLKSVNIKNFRCIKNICVDLDYYTVLIGENNSGKTSFLDAIRKTLTRINGRYTFDDYDFYMDESVTSPKESDGIEITLIFQEKNIAEWEGFVINTFGDIIQYLDEKQELGSIIIRVTSAYNKETNEHETKGVFLNNKFEEVDSKAQNKISYFYNYYHVFYLQALRNINDTFSSRSPMWGKFLKKANIPQEKLKELQDDIAILNKDIINNDANLSKLVNSLEEVQKVLDFQGDDLVSIDALPMKSWDLLSKAQLVLNNVNNVSFPLEKHGQGTQSVATILLFKAYISVLLEELNSNNKALLMIEEPEAHLHPQAVHAIERVITNLKCQKIITTHSPYFIQNIDLKNIRLFRKNGGVTEVTKIINQVLVPLDDINENIRKVVERHSDIFELNESSKELIVNKPISKAIETCLKGCIKIENLDNYVLKSREIFSAKELHNLNIYVQRTRGEILFARKWVLYEGQTEDIIVQYFSELLGYNMDQYGISGIFYRSNGTAGSFVKLARVLGIKWVLLADNDEQGENTKKEIINSGYDEDEIKKSVFLTNKKDIENELLNNGFLKDYEKIVENSISIEIKKLKEDGKVEEYKKEIIKLIQKDKVKNAYKLIEIWKSRNLSKEEIPLFFKNFIKKVYCNEL